jgi:Kef-type K+ transport system membrane component KefB
MGGMIVGALLVLLAGLGQLAFAPERWLRVVGVIQVWLAGMVFAGVYFMWRAEQRPKPERRP